MLRIGCLIRRKRILALYGCVGVVVIFSVMMLAGNYPVEKASDYDLTYNLKKSDDPSWINEGNYIDESSVVRNSIAIQQGVDRKPQAQIVKDVDTSYSEKGSQTAEKHKVKYRFQSDVAGADGINQFDQYQAEEMYDKDKMAEGEEDINAVVIEEEEEEDEDYEESDYDYFQSNPFKEGDFDNVPSQLTKQPLKYRLPESAKETNTSIKARMEKSSAQLVPLNDRTMHEKEHKRIASSTGFEVNAGSKQSSYNEQQGTGLRVDTQGSRLNGLDTPLSAGTKPDTNRAIRQEKRSKPCETNKMCDLNADIPNAIVKRPIDDKNVLSLLPGMSVKSASRHGNSVGNKAQVVTKSGDKGSQHIPKNKNHSSEWAEDLPDNLASKIETQIPIQDGLRRYPALQQQPATQIQIPKLSWQPGEVRSVGGTPLVVDKIFWSEEVEQLVPKGTSDKGFQNYLHTLSNHHVTQMLASDWTRCGRPKNQYVVLDDGTAMCARYRHPHDKLVQGEVMSFYLSRLLGLDNVPFVVLSQVNSSQRLWSGQDFLPAQWEEGRYVGLIQWIEGLERKDKYRSRVKMPPLLLEEYEKNATLDYHNPGLTNLTADQLADLLQWSDMVIFDYLTGNYDRVASMQDGADRAQNPDVIRENIRNLRKIWQTRKLWLIDNESGFLDSYDLMYRGREHGRVFQQFHTRVLQTVCIFRRETAGRIFDLASVKNPDEVLINYSREQDPLFDKLPQDSAEFKLFHKYFHTRLKSIKAWIVGCQSR